MAHSITLKKRLDFMVGGHPAMVFDIHSVADCKDIGYCINWTHHDSPYRWSVNLPDSAPPLWFRSLEEVLAAVGRYLAMDDEEPIPTP